MNTATDKKLVLALRNLTFFKLIFHFSGLYLLLCQYYQNVIKLY